MNPSEPPQQSTTTAATNTAARPSITEKNYPISIRWVWANVAISLAAFPLYFLYLISEVGFVFSLITSLLIIIINITVVIMQRKYYHFEFGDQYITIRQGVIKRKERHLPYGVIQNVMIKRSLSDRLFGLATINVQNAVQQRKPGGPADSADAVMGSSGTDFNLPGQTPKNAEVLRKIVLEKMKENPDWGIHAGL